MRCTADGDLLGAVGPESAGDVPGAVWQLTEAGAAVLGSGQRAGPSVWAFLTGVAVRGGDPSSWKEEFAALEKGRLLGKQTLALRPARPGFVPSGLILQRRCHLGSSARLGLRGKVHLEQRARELSMYRLPLKAVGCVFIRKGGRSKVAPGPLSSR